MSTTTPMVRGVAVATAALFAAALLGGCAGDREDAPFPRDPRALSEPIAVRMGTRDVRVRCVLVGDPAPACETTRDQLTRLRDGCMIDPISTPHHLDPSRALIALGCCTEAATAYQRACDDGATSPCVSRWSAECESGRIPSP